MSTPRRTAYLDNAASTALVPQARAAMLAAWEEPGNSSSLHGAGRRARRLLEEARESIATDLGARPSEVVFTSGGTESDNLALKGIFLARRAGDERRTRIVISAVEHHAVLDPAQWLADQRGAELVVLPVDAAGRIDPAALRDELAAHADRTALISVMWANNEVGAIQPIAEIAALGAEFGVPVHSDAIAAAGHVPVSFAVPGLTALSVAGHKFGGPQGSGALLIRRDAASVPLLHGGGHERDLRSGTPDVAAAAGMAAALRAATTGMAAHTEHLRVLRERLTQALTAIDGVRINSGDDGLPTVVHVSVAGCEGDSLLMLLDARGVECSTGSACTAGVASASHVLLAMGIGKQAARGSLRFSFAPSTTTAEVDLVAEVIGDVVDRARAAGMLSIAGGGF